MNRILVWGTLALVLVAVNLSIADKQQTLAEGTVMLLEIGPRDPRSIMQGDYMVLRYAMQGEVTDGIGAQHRPHHGRIVVTLDANQVARFQRFYEGGPLAEGERLLEYRKRADASIGANAFFFQEGQADLYSMARYGELRVDAEGGSVLVGLRDGRFRPLGPDRQ